MSLVSHRKDWDFDSLCEYISDIISKESGNVLGVKQRSMVENRLKKRLMDLGNISASNYYEHLDKNYENEIKELVSLLTTHHTFFFREFIHFEYMRDHLDEIVNKVKKRGGSKIRVFSAACSRGQEVYSLAMFFKYHLKQYPGIDFEVVGSDIDSHSVDIAKNGVYPYNEVKTIPQIYLEGHWQRGTGEISRFAKVKNELKQKCLFETMNLMDMRKIQGQQFDIILCRNVFIYFEMDMVAQIVQNFKKFLYDDGIFITGLSESLNNLSFEKRTLAPSVYSFNTETPIEEKPVEETLVAKTVKSLIPKPIRVLAVDDSKSVLKLLSKIFSDDDDFELVGTAENGVEAAEFLKNNEVDAMTLDIHMPEMDGVEYLKKHYHPKHPHVLMVSSASREDVRYAQQSLSHGANDFVEKPALNNLKDKAEEIKTKLKMSFLIEKAHQTKLDKQMSHDYSINDVENTIRAFVANYSDIKRIKTILSELKGKQSPIFLFLQGNEQIFDMIKNELDSWYKTEFYEEGMQLNESTVYLSDFKQDFEHFYKTYSSKHCSLSLLGLASDTTARMLEKFNLNFREKQLLVEDLEGQHKKVCSIANDIFPWTSFSHMGTQFLAGEE
jgi:chemotaxis protein methyltransferase CheR